MNVTLALRAALAVLALILFSQTTLTAQNLLLTNYKGKFLPVVRARNLQPYVEANGKQVAGDGSRYALHKVDEFLPVFISVRDIEVGTFHIRMENSDINNEFWMRANLITPYELDDVFLVLELDTDRGGKMLFLYEVGRLRANDAKYITPRVQMNSGLGAGHYKMHLFSKGREVMHSLLDPTYCDEVVDRMILKRITPIKEDSAPKLFIGPIPEYPTALLKKKVSGKSVVSLRIGPNGRVYDPVLKSASESAFGEAALAAVRMWRFLPRIKDGRAVETVAELPLDFDPPPEKSKKS